MRRCSYTKKGESLIEVIIAIFVVAIGTGAATTLIVSALQANSFSRDNLVALNVAVEGLEAVRTVRDTNWLKFGYDKEHCWNVLPEMGPGTDCTDAQSLIGAGYYTADLNLPTYNWKLGLVGTDPTLALNLHDPKYDTKDYILGFIDSTPGQDTNKNGNTEDDPDLYITYGYIGKMGIPDTGISRFYRMITITYLDDPSPTKAREMRVDSLVQWRDRGEVHQVNLSTILTNYQKE